MKQTDAVQLAFKRETDPKGLLNPGKMIAWDDPNFDYSPRKEFLISRAGGARTRPRRILSHAHARPLRASRRDELRRGAPCDRSSLRCASAATTSTIAILTPRRSTR